MIAAIYARKSTEQLGVADDQKSVARQIAHARAYAERKGWTVAEDQTFVDDGISGAEFANRPGFLRLMNALKPRPRFGVLVMSEESRLGREAIETAYALKQLVTAGVRVFFYLEDRERTLDSPTDKIMLSLTAFADELEREKARQRTYDAMARKAKAGHVTGGRVFGYDNVDVVSPAGERSHVERRINETEAAIVRRIFEWSAAGTGYSRIARLLNEERAPAPRPQQGRPSAWAPSTVRDVLHRPIYGGEIVWNQTRKRDRWGQQHQHARPPADWLHVTAPELRVVPADLWQAVASRLREIPRHTGRSVGGRPRDIESKYLLPGFARCALCGGAFSVLSRAHGSRRAYFYACNTHFKKGASLCGNTLVRRMEEIDDAVLKELGGAVLRPVVVRAVVAGVLEAMQPPRHAHDVDDLRSELDDVDQEIGRLTTAIATGGQLPPLLGALQVRQTRREDLAAKLALRQTVRLGRFDRADIEAKALACTDRWRQMLTSDVQEGRQVLREVLVGPLRFAPEGRAYRFEGEAPLGRTIAALIGVPDPQMWRPQRDSNPCFGLERATS